MKLLPREFYSRDTSVVARELLGKKLVRRIGGTTISGTIIETEAYKHRGDPASHAYAGMTERNRAMFGEVGMAYIYFTYGMYYCVNAVAKSQHVKAGAVLIRAVRPDRGVDMMAKNRKNKRFEELADGPAKLTQAMGIDGRLYGADLSKRGELFIAEGMGEKIRIRASARIGISKAADKKWNYKISI